MADCPSSNEKLFGRAVILEVAEGCPNAQPAETAWKALMAGTSKGVDYSPNTVTSDADDTKGFVENIVTSTDLTVKFEGEVRVNDKSDEYGFYKLERYFVNEVTAMRQPTLWVRMHKGTNIFVGYMVLTSLSHDGGTNDIVTASLEFKVADASTVKLIEVSSTVEPEPEPEPKNPQRVGK